MRLFDSGVNLLDPRFDVEAVLNEAMLNQVDQMLVISSDLSESHAAIRLKEQYDKHPVGLHVTAGVHPHYADNAISEHWEALNLLLETEEISAVGECGLDFNRNFSTPENQIAAFDKQLQIAISHNKGVYLHERDAFEQQMKMLKPVSRKLRFLVAHCFTGNSRALTEYLNLGCYIGVTGWVCDDKRGQDLQAAVKNIPLSRLLLETDAPYLLPKTVKPRVKLNTPKYLHVVAKKVAEIKELPIHDVYQAAYRNACHLFAT